MFENATKILNILEDNGYKAYIVGGYVRDYIMKRPSNDIDISTNARPEDILNVFKDYVLEENYGSVKIKYNDYIYEITSFRKETYDKGRKPISTSYVDEISEDIKRRDFTINSLYMDKDKNIIDLLGGKKDIERKVIKSILDPNIKFKEDILRLLRAIRFSTILDFKIDEETSSAIIYNKKYLKDLSFNRKKEELDKIFSSNNIDKGLEYLNRYNLLDALSISIKEKVIKTKDVIGIWAQLDFSNEYPFKKSELNIINNIKNIINYGKIDALTLYKYPLDTNLIAGEILKVRDEDIVNTYNNLNIHNVSEVDITLNEISELLNKDIRDIKSIMNDIEQDILFGNIENDNAYLKDYILKKYGGLLNEG